jgi:D-beta-D-heptose 7-phosphate kinase/D-beta-D-heptose 1-phosphate adenosyltransferase
MQIIKKVWVNGCFDVLHRGHIELLKYAKNQGTFLIVGIDTDDRIKKMKGVFRPFNNQEDRLFFLESIKYVDHIELFDSDEELIEKLSLFKPDVMVVGSDYKDKQVIGSEHANELIFFDRIKGYSTTRILENK